MQTINGLPAHVLLVHAVVVLVPLTASLAVLAAVWPSARRALIWLTTVLAAVTMVLTPITVDAGETFARNFGPSETLRTHADLGSTMTWFVVPLVVLTVALLVVHLRERRGKPLARVLVAALAVLVIVAGVAATVQVFRVGESGARAVWGAPSGTAALVQIT
ncbi:MULTISPECIES: DUF2231 domain-containing protein [Nocardia]|uniref:DUF2231 domain-containing protein n=1 Tax=Nocardia TaxID=1817 RepID=UPI000D699BE3|nr:MULTISPECIES: DUF2231 domain-containing protein [Nocardia]